MNLQKEREYIKSLSLGDSKERKLLNSLESISEKRSALLVDIKDGINRFFLIISAASLLVMLIAAYGLKVLNLMLAMLLIGVFSGILIVSSLYIIKLFLMRQRVTKLIGSSKIEYPPGITTMKIIGFIYPLKVKERVFEPIIADMQEEYFSAMEEQDKWKCRWVHFRGIVTVLMGAISQFPLSILKVILKIG